MSISNISSNVSSKIASSLIQQHSTSTAKSTSTVSSSNNTYESDPARVSKMGDLMKRLDSLSKTDPNKFKEMSSTISEELTQLASTLSGDEATKVSDLASKFADAVISGDSQSLRPSKPPPPPGVPQVSAAAYGQTQGMSTNGKEVRTQIDNILSSVLSSLTKTT